MNSRKKSTKPPEFGQHYWFDYTEHSRVSWCRRCGSLRFKVYVGWWNPKMHYEYITPVVYPTPGGGNKAVTLEEPECITGEQIPKATWTTKPAS